MAKGIVEAERRKAAIAIIEKDAGRLRDAVIALQESVGDDHEGLMTTRVKCAHAAWSACCPEEEDAEINHDLEDTALAMFLAVWFGAYGRGDKTDDVKFSQLMGVVRFAMTLDNMGEPTEDG